MTRLSSPVTDDHIHIDPRNGRGLAAARDFFRSGGTHIFLVSKPSSSFGILPLCGEDFRPVFEETLSVAEMVSGTGVVVFPVLGVHPAEITRLLEHVPLERAAGIMKEGIDLAARFVEEGRAVAIKSGRPAWTRRGVRLQAAEPGAGSWPQGGSAGPA